MASIDISQIIETTAPAVPQIYAYTTPEIARHNGRNQRTLTEYFMNMPDRDKVMWVCSDMYRVCKI